MLLGSDLSQDDQWVPLHHGMGAQGHLTQHVLPISYKVRSGHAAMSFRVTAVVETCVSEYQVSVYPWWPKPMPPPCPPPTSQGLFHHELHDDGLVPQQPLRGQISHSRVVRVFCLERVGGHRYPDQPFLRPSSTPCSPLHYPESLGSEALFPHSDQDGKGSEPSQTNSHLAASGVSEGSFLTATAAHNLGPPVTETGASLLKRGWSPGGI